MSMNKLKNVTFATLLLVLLTTLFSCSKDTVDELHRATFKWTTDYTGDPRNITVPAEGGTYKLVCADYQTLRFANMAAEESAAQYGDKVISTAIMGRWYTAELTGNTLTITIKPNTTGKKRKVNFWFRADDAVDRVEITQEK
ncbi:BACON domain-containing protein [Prevotella melaninogenica]|uniref:BACON domain-containing protein n=1 Tax=Prevotella melaninogenica TaxID=28132 RepID=UPI001BA497C2|nr:BACON domain-containing protein [Prevotella melaninogenica]QUB69328.1 BACON domain-containing protein [Prevotella melaninogenica]